MSAVSNNEAKQRFELPIEGAIAFANYVKRGDALIITHTETPVALRGRGVAADLMQGLLDIIRADGKKVVAGCSYAVDYLEKHPEYADLTG